MSEVINKKLHPYYKTGIYGWIGEEVDDNDYIICPICGDVLGVNYCDYSAEQGYYDKCPKCKQELDYSEIYDFEDACYFEQLLEIKESRLADLEAKLADAEFRYENLHNLYYKDTEKLKQQLAEKENLLKMYPRLEDMYPQLPTIVISNQDKISFAVERLEKAKELLNEYKWWQNPDEDGFVFNDYAVDWSNVVKVIDNQIKAIKEMK